jgi:two-component system response regulator NreC
MLAHLHLARSPVPAASGLPLTESIRVVVADDHALMRRSLRRLLEAEQNIDVVAETHDLTSTLRHVHSRQPHVLVLDLGMPVEALATIGQLREHARDTQLVALSMDHDPVFAQRALAAGALGFVSKELADRELPQAVRAAATEEQYVSPRVRARLSALQRSLTDDELTAREVDVLRLTALGHTSAETARRLHLSPRTIEAHRLHIYDKLGLQRRADLVRYALRRGLLRA